MKNKSKVDLNQILKDAGDKKSALKKIIANLDQKKSKPKNNLES